MSRHQGVYNMIRRGNYDDDEYEDDDDQQQEPQNDDYADENFTISELRVINYLCEIFIQQLSRKDIIDALYETDGNQDAAFEYLSNKINKQKNKKQQNNQQNVSQSQKQNQVQKSKQQDQIVQSQQQSINQQLQPLQLNKQATSNDKSKNQFHVEFNIQQYNAHYPQIQYKGQIQNNSNSTSIIILGHVDTGKSTLTGKLLQLLKAIDEKEIRKNTKEAKGWGKEASSFAYVTDCTREEKEKGVTMDMAYKCVTINGRTYNLLDSPGHQDFAPHLFTGAAQADYAILVVDTTKNAFDNSVRCGSLQERLMLLRGLNIQHTIIALNKMDQIDWEKKQFDYALKIIQTNMGKLGYNFNSVSYIPVSAFQGQNLIEKYPNTWYNGQTLIEAMLKLPLIEKTNNGPFRFTIINRYHQNEGKLRGTCLFGKLESGQLEKNQMLVILPQGIYCEIKEFEKQGNQGDLLDLRIKTVNDSDFQQIVIGSILSSQSYHVPVANRFVCQLSTLELATPIIRGSQFLMHINAQKVPVTVKKLNILYDEDAVSIKKKFPRALISNQYSEVELESDSLICVETYENLPSLSRFILREKFNLTGIGRITEIQVNLSRLQQGRVIHEQQI